MDKLQELRSQWIGKYVTVSNGEAREVGVVIDIRVSGRKLGRIGYPYWISFDWGGGIPWSENTVIEETAR